MLAASLTNKLYADIILGTSPLAAASINQGTNTNVVYIAQMEVTTDAATVNNIQFTLSGTHDADDLTTLSIYYNATAPTVAGSVGLNTVAATFASSYTYSIPVNNPVALGSAGYFIVAVNTSPTATDNNTIEVNAATDPVVFSFTTAPNITDNQSDAAGTQTIQAADITLTTSPVAAADINQGTNTNIVYIAQMSVATEPATVNNIQFTLSGIHDADDLTTLSIYYNATAPTVAGSVGLNTVAATFAAPHTYSIPVNNPVIIGSAGYFIITINTSPAATDNNTIEVNAAADPVVFGFTTAPNITDNQSDAAGTQTIQAADITLTTSPLAAADINQGTNTNIVYIAQMAVSTEPVTVNNIQFALGGTHDADDLTTLSIYYNATAPTVAGSVGLNTVAATFASSYTYSIPVNNPVAVGSAGYFIITVNTSPAATDNNTIEVNATTDAVVFGFTTAPNITDNQSDAAGTQTIQAADITLATSPVAAADINQGTNTNIVYIAQMSVATEPATVNNIQFTLNGTHDADDLTTLSIYYNATAPTVAGSVGLNTVAGTFASPHTYSIPVNNPVIIGSAGYFIITVNTSPSATDNNTIEVNATTDAVVFGFTTAPNITDNQSDAAGTQTIQAADITLTTSPVAAADINQGTNTNIVYIAQMSVATQPATVNNIQFTLSGTHDADDLTTLSIYYNATAPTVAGSVGLNTVAATFASPYTYSTPVNVPVTVGSAGYFIIAVNTSPSATDNNTIEVNAAADPVVFGFTTAPNITDNQSDAAGTQTIQAADITLSTFPVATNTFQAGTNTNIVYIAQMSVATQPATVNSMQFTLSGTHDADDLTTLSVYYNPTTPTIAGSVGLNTVEATFSSPHTYSIAVNNPVAVGSAGYFIITVNTNSAATNGNTVLINGAGDPVIFGFTTAPNITNNQTDNGGIHTLPVNFINVRASGKVAGVEVEWKVGSALNIDKYIVERSGDGRSFRLIGEKQVGGNGANTVTYNFLDAKPLAGNNFYRINAVDKDGRIKYSAIIKINLNIGEADFSLYPNPAAKNSQLNLELINLKKDAYTLTIFNRQGQLVNKQMLKHSGGNSVQTFNLSEIAAGMYTIEVRNKNMRFVKRLIVK